MAARLALACLLLSLVVPFAPLNGQAVTERSPRPGVPASVSGAATAERRESFTEFLARFERDSAFQWQRVRFPLPWYSAAEGRTKRIGRASWERLALAGGQEAYARIFDNFAMRDADTNERVFSLIGFASDIRQDFFFRREGGRWYLVRVADHSM